MLFDRAAASAAAREGLKASRMWAAMALWLRLRDQGATESAKATLAKGLADPERALSLLPLALDFDVPVDRAAAERAIQNRLAAEPSGSIEIARARLALILSEPAPEDKAVGLSAMRMICAIFRPWRLSISARCSGPGRKGEEARSLIDLAERRGFPLNRSNGLRKLSQRRWVHEPPARPDLDPATATTPHLLWRWSAWLAWGPRQICGIAQF